MTVIRTFGLLLLSSKVPPFYLNYLELENYGTDIDEIRSDTQNLVVEGWSLSCLNNSLKPGRGPAQWFFLYMLQ